MLHGLQVHCDMGHNRSPTLVLSWLLTQVRGSAPLSPGPGRGIYRQYHRTDPTWVATPPLFRSCPIR